MVDTARAVQGLRELARLTSDERGAQRVAWTDTWIAARDWLRAELDAIPGVAVDRDAAGNTWATLPGDSERFVIVGSHLDSVPDGGWLDGTLGVVAALEVLRALAGEPRRADRQARRLGRRGGRALRPQPARLERLRRHARPGRRARADRRRRRRAARRARRPRRRPRPRRRGRASACAGAAAYLELHIEQGPVLERLGLPLGVVLGSFGVERHRLRFTGAHAHAGASPMDARRDAFVAAARSAVAFRDDAAGRADVRATTGRRTRRARHPDGLQRRLRADARPARARRGRAGRHARGRPPRGGRDRRRGGLRGGVGAGLRDRADPVRPRADRARRGRGRELAGACHSLPSGPLHDASEMARVLPAAMLFVRSLGGVSHTSAEDSRVEDIELGVRALYELTLRVCGDEQPASGDRAARDGTGVRTASRCSCTAAAPGPETMLDLAGRLAAADVRCVLPAAAGDTWYPQRFTAPLAANEPWLTYALEALGAARAAGRRRRCCRLLAGRLPGARVRRTPPAPLRRRRRADGRADRRRRRS